MAEGALIFIAGGVRSGKSAYAEAVVRDIPAARKVYIASGVAHDAEMAERIARHRQDRAQDGWWTIEQPQRLAEAEALILPGDAVLWDCVTTWLANELYEEQETGIFCAEQAGCMERKWSDLQQTIVGMRQKAACIVAVSNEVLDEPAISPAYQQWLGQIHQWLVEQADSAIEMENGLAIKRK